MGDLLHDARAAGDTPQAPGFLGWTSILGATMGLAFTAANAPWMELASAGWGLEGSGAIADAAMAVTFPCVAGTVVGALIGLIVGAAGLGSIAPALRMRTRGRAPSRGFGVAALAAIALAALFVPRLAARVGGGDPGRLLAYTPLAVLFLGALALTPIAFWNRARGVNRWRKRLLADDPPRRDPDHIQPQLKSALKRRARADSIPADSLSVVISAGEYVVGLVFAQDRAPRVARHGGFFLHRGAVAAGIRVVVDPLLAHALAGVPTGDPAPASTWPKLTEISRLSSGENTHGDASEETGEPR